MLQHDKVRGAPPGGKGMKNTNVGQTTRIFLTSAGKQRALTQQTPMPDNWSRPAAAIGRVTTTFHGSPVTVDEETSRCLTY